MADSAVTVKVVREVDLMRLVSAPLRQYFEGCLLVAYGDVATPGRVPIDTGYLRASLQPGAGVSKVDPSDPPQWAELGTNVSNAGVNYGSVLEESDKTHYAHGPSLGKPTKGWLSQTVKNVAGDVKNLQARMAADIKKGWR